MAVVDVCGPQPYQVFIDHDTTLKVGIRVQELGARKALIVHQPPLAAVARSIAQDLENNSIEPHLAAVPDAEDGKSIAVASELWDVLGRAGFSRQDAVVTVGGGAATDMGGFIAATWMRGIDVVHVPTTLLAMVDAAVGGKTGMNTAEGKNLVGAFHEPKGVFIDLERVYTLPEEEIVSGSAELIKTGFIADPKILDLFQEGASRHWPELIERSVAVKAGVVSEDLKESGLREILNYGHTLGHAIERREQYRWRHGNAVAVGMMFVAYLALQRGLIDESVVSLHRTILEAAGLPTRYEHGVFDELYEGMTRDKKNKNGHIRFVVLDGIGSCTRIEDATKEEMRAAYEAMMGD